MLKIAATLTVHNLAREPSEGIDEFRFGPDSVFQSFRLDNH